MSERGSEQIIGKNKCYLINGYFFFRRFWSHFSFLNLYCQKAERLGEDQKEKQKHDDDL